MQAVRTTSLSKGSKVSRSKSKTNRTRNTSEMHSVFSETKEGVPVVQSRRAMRNMKRRDKVEFVSQLSSSSKSRRRNKIHKEKEKRKMDKNLARKAHAKAKRRNPKEKARSFLKNHRGCSTATEDIESSKRHREKERKSGRNMKQRRKMFLHM